MSAGRSCTTSASCAARPPRSRRSGCPSPADAPRATPPAGWTRPDSGGSHTAVRWSAMSSDRPVGPADVVPDGDGPEEPSTGEQAETAAEERPARRRRRRRRDEPKKKGSLLRELPVLLLIAFVLALLVKTFLVQAFFIPSGSMEQTLHGCPGCTGDRVLVNKVPYWFGEPRPGNVIVFQGPDTWAPEITVEEPSN